MRLCHLWTLALLSLAVACSEGDDTASGGGAGGAGGANTGAVNEYPVTDPGIVTMGRAELIEATGAASAHLRTSAPAASMRARFRGDAVTVLLADQHRYGDRDYYDVVSDDEIVWKLGPEPDVSEYEVPASLEYRQGRPGAGDLRRARLVKGCRFGELGPEAEGASGRHALRRGLGSRGRHATRPHVGTPLEIARCRRY
ncbi:MAG: hypothetical protein JW751_19825 [Polyangiaceae bacterium]|nr:hypothetical protein [Polyangiaceae bacterium]